MLQRAFFTSQMVRGLAPSLTAAVHSSASLKAAAATAQQQQVHSALQGLLGLSGAEVATLLASEPALVSEKPSVLQERMQFLASGLGISSNRLRSLVVEKPALLSDLSIRELRSMAGLSE